MSNGEEMQATQASAPVATTASRPLAIIEADVRSLMMQVSQANAARHQLESQHSDFIRKLLLDLFEALDAFERVFRNIRAKEDQVTPQMKVWLGNFRTVRRLLDKALAEHGVSRIEILDQAFDPHWHRVSEVVQDASKAEGTIIEEVKAGYIWSGQVIRKAEVVVVAERAHGRFEEQEGKAQNG